MSSSTGTVVFDDAKLQAVDVVATGNVGIGTTNPSFELDVFGEAKISSNVEIGTANLFVDTTTGNVGVGTTNPQAPLDINDTSSIIIPVGTSSQRPSAPALGMLRFNTSTGKLEIFNGLKWGVIIESDEYGGVITDITGYRLHTYNVSGTFTAPSSGQYEYLVVAGGGGGGMNSGAGGGAGGMLSGTLTLSSGEYVITVGSGGAGGTTSSVGTLASNGTDSLIVDNFGTTLVQAYGGGGGTNSGGTSGANGGSGGGAANLVVLVYPDRVMMGVMVPFLVVLVVQVPVGVVPEQLVKIPCRQHKVVMVVRV